MSTTGYASQLGTPPAALLTKSQDGNHQYGDNDHNEVDYVDDAQIYEYDHGGGNEQPQHGGGVGYNGHDGYGHQQQQQQQQQGKDYYGDHYQDHGDQGRRDPRDDMW